MSEPKPHSKLDGDDPRIDSINRAIDYVPLSLYDKMQKPAEEAIGELIREHNGLIEQLEALQKAAEMCVVTGFASYGPKAELQEVLGTIRERSNPASELDEMDTRIIGNQWRESHPASEPKEDAP